MLYLSGGTIPDRGYYELRGRDGALIGELDEEFVWERSTGDFFTLGTQTWRVDNITDRAVEVTPADAGGAMSPFWKADPNGRDFFYSSLILACWTGRNRCWRKRTGRRRRRSAGSWWPTTIWTGRSRLASGVP